MAFFRTVSFSELLPAIAGEGVVLRAPQMSDYAEWAALREASRDFLTPWEPTWPADDLTPRRRSAAASSAIPRTSAAISPIAFFIFRKHGQRAGRRPDARQYPARLRPGRQPRLLDGRGLCAPGLHDRGGRAPSSRSPSARCGCIASRRPAFPPTSRRSGCWKRPASSARALPANISASTASGRTICSMRVSRTIRRLNQSARGRPWARHGLTAITLGDRRDACRKSRVIPMASGD